MDLHDSISEELECPICYGRYHNPLLLECHHSFCRKCLEKSQQPPDRISVHQTHILCPLCRQPTYLPPTGIAGLQQDFKLNRLLQIVDTHEAKGNPGIDFCGTCPRENPASVASYCTDCSVAMCKQCARIHCLIPATRKHSVVEVSGLSTDEMDIDWPEGEETTAAGEGFMESSRMLNDHVNDCFTPGCSCTVL